MIINEEGVSVVSEVSGLWRDSRGYYREYFQLVERCKDFLLRQAHYADDPGITLDDARLAPKGAELNDQHRYKLAQILSEGPYVETHPRDVVQDPQASEYAKRVLMSIVEDNTNRYSKFRRRVVSGALAVGTGYGMVHWKADRGPMGDVVFESLEPQQVLVCPGYLDAHDPCCPWLIIERHEPVKSVKAKGGDGEYDWKNTADLWPDNRGRYGTEEEWVKASAEPSPNEEYGAETVTVLYCYYRTSGVTYSSEAGSRSLGQDDQYMACAECDYRSMDHERMPDGGLPEMGSACPQCLAAYMDGKRDAPAYLYRVTSERLTEERLKHPKGRLVIVAPVQHREFYDGDWQAPTRSFPVLQCRAYENPYELMGGSDTLLYWSLQALMDQIRKQAYDQMVTSKPIIIVSGDPDGKSLVDASGRPFMYTAESGQMAYWNGPPGMVQSMIHQFSPQGMPAALPTLYNIISQSFYQARGVGQVQFGPEQSKDVAYRSLLLQKESGDIPVEDHKQIWREEEGLFLGCVLDVWTHNSSSARAIRYLGPDGTMGFQLLKGSDIPNVDVSVGTPPQIKQGAIDEVQALTQWAQIPIPSVRRIVARRLNLAPSEVAEVEAELMAAQAPPGAMPMGAQNGAPPPDIAAAMAGANPPQMGA